MSQTLRAIQHLIDQGDVGISAHGYDELAADAISTRAVIGGVGEAVVVEDYPEVTAYRPDPRRWSGDYLRRRS